MKRSWAILAVVLTAIAFGESRSVRAEPKARSAIRITPDMPEPLKAAITYYNGGPLLFGAKILEGAPEQSGANPWQVAIVYADETAVIPFCGGSLIANGWVLTAAHCVGEGLKTSNIRIFTGVTNLDQAGIKAVAISDIIVNPGYKIRAAGLGFLVEKALVDDLALLKLASTPTAGGQPIPLADARSMAAFGPESVVHITGWGATAARPQFYVPTANETENIRVLRGVDLVIKAQADCNNRSVYNGLISDGMICAGPTKINSHADSCKGDSGGPMTGLGGAGRVLVGIVSWGDGCGQPGKFGVYTRVASYRDWIDNCVQGKACPRMPPGPTPQVQG